MRPISCFLLDTLVCVLYLHVQAETGAPCLSFDIMRDSLGDGRAEFPLTAYLVAGTQAEVARKNMIILMKMSQLHKTAPDEGWPSG